MAISERRFSTNDPATTNQPPAARPPAPTRPAPAPPARPAAYVAPVDREDMDQTRPYFLGALALIFFALSSVGTIVQTRVILGLFGANVGLVAGALMGVGLAVVISAGEFYSSESPWYLCFLIPDVALTVWWMAPACATFAANVGIVPWMAYAVGAAVGIISAYLPERVVLGQRRRRAKVRRLAA